MDTKDHNDQCYVCDYCWAVFSNAQELQVHHFQCFNGNSRTENKNSMMELDFKDSIQSFPSAEKQKSVNCRSRIDNIEVHDHLQNNTYFSCEAEMNELYDTNSNDSNKDNSLSLNISEEPVKLKESGSMMPVTQNKFTSISHQKTITAKKPKRFITLNRGSPPFFCKLCSTFYTNYASYRRHLRMHIDGRNHVCESCGMQFYRRYLLNQHRINVHAAYSQGGMWKCHLCDRWLKGSDKLKKHLEVVHCSSGQAKRSRRKIEYLLQTVASLVDKDDKDEINKVVPIKSVLSQGLASSSSKDTSYSNLNSQSHNSKKYIPSQKSLHSFHKPLIKRLNRRCYVCETCKKVFVYHTSYLQHRKMHTRSKPFMCQYCCLSFLSADTLALHKKKHQPNPRYICYLCGYRTGNSSVLMAHFLEHSPAVDKSSTNNSLQQDSDKSFKEKESANEISQNAAYCKYCRKIFLNINNYDRHMRLHKSNFQWFSCTYCGKLSPSLLDHKKHIATHPSAPFSCSKCKAPFKTEALLNQHSMGCPGKGILSSSPAEHGSEKEGLFASSLPTRRSARLLNKQKVAATVALSSDQTTSIHEEPKQRSQRLMSKEKRTAVVTLSSDCASKQFEESKQHIQKFICNLCKHSFTNKDSFRRHKRMHSNKHRHSCEYCGKYFFRKDQCRHHEISVHSTEQKKAYCCYYCKVTFSDAETLKNHVSSHKTPPSTLGHSAFSTITKDDYGNEYTTTRSVVKSETTFSPLFRGVNYSERKSDDPQFYQFKPDTEFFQSIQNKSALKAKNNLFGHKPQPTPLKTKMETSKQNTHVLVIGQGEDKNKTISASDKHKAGESSQTYKCGRCSISFKDLQGILDHFQDVHGVVKIQQPSESVYQNGSQEQLKSDAPQEKSANIPKNIQTIENTITSTDEGKPKIVEVCSLSDFEEIQNSDTIKISERVSSFQSIKNSELNDTELQAEVLRQGPYRRCSRCCRQFRSISSLINHICEKERSIPTSQTQDDVSCSLCLKEFENKSLLATHTQLNHMLVEWYQCLVCSMSGPKDKMTQHMLSHMYKVGSFVVEGEENKCEYILPFLPGAAQKKNQRTKIPTKQLQTEVLESVTNQSCIPPEEFPMHDVFCKVCNRIFTCLAFLLRHKCITRIARGPFSCCIARCSSQLATKGDMIAHIKKFHYRPIQSSETLDNSTPNLPSVNHVIKCHEKTSGEVSSLAMSGLRYEKDALGKYSDGTGNEKNHKETHAEIISTSCEDGRVLQTNENSFFIPAVNQVYESQDYEEITVEPSLDVFTDMMDCSDKEQEGAKDGHGEKSIGSKRSASQLKPPAYSIFELSGQQMFKCEDCVQVFTNSCSWKEHCQQHMEGNLQ